MQAPADRDQSAKGSNRPNFVKAIGEDQIAIWSSPLRIKKQQLPMITGLGLFTAALTQFDGDINHHLHAHERPTVNHGADAGIAMFAGAAGTFYLAGRLNGNAHAQETGVLISEAAINAFFVNSVLQKAFGRARPFEAHAGDFWHGGSSFPSNHSAVAWASATVIAHEYPGWATKLLSYGAASAISASRVVGNQHFTSDVVVGSALGWFVGEQVYKRRHDPNLPGENWGTFVRQPFTEAMPNPMHQGSVYVPLDSWVYSAFDRLAGLGYAPSGIRSMRPWTRNECARLLAAAISAGSENERDASSIIRDLRREFAQEMRLRAGSRNIDATVESVYTRVIGISGPPLTDGFHFGQTIVNDYGRPYQRGFNLVSGVSTHVEAGPLAFYVQGEYQHAPAAPPLPDSIRAATAHADSLPVAPAVPIAQINRFRLLDSYVALNLKGWQASFGKQSLWWGPGESGDLMFSNNAEPITMLRLNRITPFRLPSILGLLGEIRNDAFLGQVDGYHFLRIGSRPTPDTPLVLVGSYDHHIDPQPYIWGDKLSLALTPNLQIGVSITAVFAGLGRPLTFGTFFHSFSHQGNVQVNEPGDRRTGFDFSYRIPGLRRWLVLYNGSMAEDEPNPIAYPRRSSMNPGIYLPQIPKVRRLDLHVESGYTNMPNTVVPSAYTNTHYAGGYTNNGQIMGSWIGQEARAYQVWSNYWFSGRTKIQFSYRKQVVEPTFIGGGDLQDFKGRYDFGLGPKLLVSSSVQYERWRFPVLASGQQSNVAVSVQIIYRPAWAKGSNQ